MPGRVCDAVGEDGRETRLVAPDHDQNPDLGVATGGLLWPLALIWAFITPSGPAASRTKDNERARDSVESNSVAQQPAPLHKISTEEIRR